MIFNFRCSVCLFVSKEFGDCKKRILYGLYGVIEHCGRGLFGGHYVAYLRRREKKIQESFVNPSRFCYNEDEAKQGEWFLTNDRQVTKVVGGFDKVKSCQAYILFYERLSLQWCTTTHIDNKPI